MLIFDDVWAFLGFLLAIASFVMPIYIILKFRKFEAWLDSRFENLSAQLAELKQLLFEEEARAQAAQSLKMSQQGALGVAIREQGKADRAAATAEGRVIVSGPGTIDEKKAALMKLAAKYPKVAEEVARALLKEFHLEQYAGLIMPMVAEAAQGRATSPTEPQGGFYGL